jgi:hypothetical protein
MGEESREWQVELVQQRQREQQRPPNIRGVCGDGERRAQLAEAARSSWEPGLLVRRIPLFILRLSRQASGCCRHGYDSNPDSPVSCTLG